MFGVRTKVRQPLFLRAMRRVMLQMHQTLE